MPSMNFSLVPLFAANHYRLIDVDLPPILPNSLNIASFPVIVLALIAASFAIGILFANAVRMKDYGWKIGLILATLLVSTFVVLFGDFRLGVDLKGGIILVYEVDQKETEAMSRQGKGTWEMGQLISVIRKRLNPDGLKEIVVRPFGAQQVEIIVPEVDPVEVRKIKETIATAGVLQFMIVAGETNDDTELVELARSQSERPGAERLSREVLNERGERVGFWATLGREDAKGGEKDPPFRALELVGTAVLRGTQSGELLNLTPDEKRLFAGSDSAFKAFLAQKGLRDVDILLKYDAEFDVRGSDLAQSNTAFDQETFGPCIHFTMTTDGSFKMGYLTQNNLHRKLAIVFDNHLLSAPVIQSKIDSNGQITGRFTQEEVDFIVGILKSGAMPVVMMKQPTSENQIGSILGRETIEAGSRAVIVALGLILLFMILYYRVAGAVAAFALTLNLLMTVAIMVLLQAPFTLPGLAGLVLTVAMSVDANVLISERMREELAKGATLRMGIRNGFDKALSAIIDGNITTFLTALVLYAIGTDQVRGFGITLMLGNITSVFTAIFCARVLLDVGERTRWLKTLRMSSFLTNPQIDWVRFFKPAAIGSVLLIIVGLIATFARGKGLFDIDLAGGSSVTFILKRSMSEAEVRQKLKGALGNLIDPETNTKVEHDVYQYGVNTAQAESVYQVVSSLSSVEELKEKVREALREPDGSDGLKTYQMELGMLTESAIEKPSPVLSAPGGPTMPGLAPPPARTTLPPTSTSPPEEKTPPATSPAEATPAKPAEPAAEKTSDKATEKASESPEKAAPKTTDPPADNPPECSPAQEEAKSEPAKSEQEKTEPAKADPAKTEPAKTEQPKTDEPAKSDTPAATTPPAVTTPPTATPTIEAAPTQPFVEAPPASPRTKVDAQLRFPGTPLSGYALLDRIKASSKDTLGREVDVIAKNWDGRDNTPLAQWDVEIFGVSQEQARQVLDNMQTSLRKEVIWQTANKIGGQVSADTRWRALGALAVSLLGIVAYVWFRFQRVAWGLAAVAALAHDALVMLTAIALSYWLAPALGFLGVEEFKISLAVVAAFLAILGYSVNDTIVIFDRLREIRGKSPEVTRQMLNDAVNQTLSRNIILAGITVTVVLILYAFGGPGIHAFAFAMLTGVISGCYTTLVIAAPLLLWLLNRGAVQGGSGVAKRDAA
jgi:SecD/SecF fusion protein